MNGSVGAPHVPHNITVDADDCDYDTADSMEDMDLSSTFESLDLGTKVLGRLDAVEKTIRDQDRLISQNQGLIEAAEKTRALLLQQKQVALAALEARRRELAARPQFAEAAGRSKRRSDEGDDGAEERKRASSRASSSSGAGSASSSSLEALSTPPPPCELQRMQRVIRMLNDDAKWGDDPKRLMRQVRNLERICGELACYPSDAAAGCSSRLSQSVPGVGGTGCEMPLVRKVISLPSPGVASHRSSLNSSGLGSHSSRDSLAAPLARVESGSAMAD